MRFTEKKTTINCIAHLVHFLGGQDENIENAIKLNLEYIKLETLTDQLHLVEQLDKGIEVSFDAVSSKLYIQKLK